MDTSPKRHIIRENNFTAIAASLIGVIMTFIMLILTLSAFLHTTGMEIIDESNAVNNALYHKGISLEALVYYNDNFLFNIIWFIIAAAVCFIVMPLLKKVPLPVIMGFVFIWTVVLGCIWVHSAQNAPSEDSYRVQAASYDFAKDVYVCLTNGDRYFYNYSFQLGYVFFNEIIIRIADMLGAGDKLIYISYVNVFLLAFGYMGLLLFNNTVFGDKRISRITGFILLFSTAPMITCSFVYGLIPGSCFSIWTVYFAVKFLKSEKTVPMVIYGLLTVCSLVIAVMIKSNNLIVLVALCAVLFVTMFSKKRIIPNVICIAAACFAGVSISPLIKGMYEKRAGVDLGDSVPFISWFDMGMCVADNAPGWYNYYPTVANFEEHGFDADAAAEASKKNIKEHVDYFLENPQFANDFFYTKFVSQWNETTYQSLWNCKVRVLYGDRTQPAEWALFKGEQKSKRYMDIYAQFIFVMVLVGVFMLIRDRNFLAVFFPLIILGGILYHLLGEAKSQYAVPYFIMMTGFAGYGAVALFDRLPDKVMKPFRKLDALCGANTVVEETASEVVNAEAEEASPEETEAEVTEETAASESDAKEVKAEEAEPSEKAETTPKAKKK
ncbi:MAG TPA: hypothetical protein PLS20_08075 [Ruminococcus flavefaciens]|nr:hypothetical protein [Ruminococcus flavefaciens]